MWRGRLRTYAIKNFKEAARKVVAFERFCNWGCCCCCWGCWENKLTGSVEEQDLPGSLDIKWSKTSLKNMVFNGDIDRLANIVTKRTTAINEL